MQRLISVCLCTLLLLSLSVSQTKESASLASDSLKNKESAADSTASVKNDAKKTDSTAIASVKNASDSGSAKNDSADSAKYYSLTIKTVPDSVAVVLNDAVAGMTPLTIEKLKSGEYTLLLKKKGYYQKKVTVIVDSTSARELNLVLQAPGTVVITSKPSGAEVTFDGVKKGVTPLSISPVKPGDYQLQLKKDTFELYKKSITVSSGKTDSVFCSLVPDTAMLNASKKLQKKERSRKTKVTSIILATAFCLFAGIVTIIDFSGN